MKKDETYYFGEYRGKAMKKMKRRELYARLADAYQLAGGFLIGVTVHEEEWDADGNCKPGRIINGWTPDEVDVAINTLLNFLSCPADVSKSDFDRANVVFRGRPQNECGEDFMAGQICILPEGHEGSHR